MSAKTFLQLQTELAALTLDTSTAWAAGWVSNKLALNNAYETLWDLLKNSGKIKRYMATAKATITLTNKVASLPAAFDIMNVVSTVDFTTESEIEMNDSMYYQWQVRGISGAKSLYIEDAYDTLYYSYVPIVTALSADGDVPTIPPELHRAIAKFALFEYFTYTREDVAAANALALANSFLNTRLACL